ncbi:MAG TPA: alanine racemase [Polyangiaceae bacterium]|nr:alanine racemase [Polyangiaceae bacterium]
MNSLRPSNEPAADLDEASRVEVPRVFRPQRALPADAVRPTRAEVNLANLRHNLRVAQRAAPGAAIWGVLKADGYGHGSKAVARTLERAGMSGVCVALLEEGIELREAGIQLPILIMGGYYGRAWAELVRHELTPVLHEESQVRLLADELRHAGVAGFKVHLKIDTGMSRLGVLPDAVEQVGELVRSRPEIALEGLMTHLSNADSGDAASVDRQLQLFSRARATLQSLGLEPRALHAANSAALLGYPSARYSMVRPGIALFGVDPCAPTALAAFPERSGELRPVMRVRTEVVALRKLSPGTPVGYGGSFRASRLSVIATIPMGYADGLSRGLSNVGHVLVRGTRAKIVGAVSMDMTMIDVTDAPGVQLGDECVILGHQKGPCGEDAIGAREIADQLRSIPWEVLTSISRRVPRFYREP